MPKGAPHPAFLEQNEARKARPWEAYVLPPAWQLLALTPGYFTWEMSHGLQTCTVLFLFNWENQAKGLGRRKCHQHRPGIKHIFMLWFSSSPTVSGNAFMVYMVVVPLFPILGFQK